MVARTAEDSVLVLHLQRAPAKQDTPACAPLDRPVRDRGAAQSHCFPSEARRAVDVGVAAAVAVAVAAAVRTWGHRPGSRAASQDCCLVERRSYTGWYHCAPENATSRACPRRTDRCSTPAVDGLATGNSGRVADPEENPSRQPARPRAGPDRPRRSEDRHPRSSCRPNPPSRDCRRAVAEGLRSHRWAAPPATAHGGSVVVGSGRRAAYPADERGPNLLGLAHKS